MTWRDIKGMDAYELLDKLEMTEPPFNPFDIARKLGVQVSQEFDFDKLGTEGQISLVDNEPVIWVNPNKNESRQRFTLAHEIGHLVNDILPEVDDPIIDEYQTLYRSDMYGGIETLANQFAARLLMPLDSIEKYIDFLREKYPNIKAKEAIEATADKFEVSKQAVFHRFKNIGLIAKNYQYPF